MSVKSIAVVGGTHGNETSGIQVVNQFNAGNLPASAKHFDVTCLLANSAAIAKNVRFVEEDLNRQFSAERLAAKNGSLEAKLAQNINQQIGPKTAPTVDLVIDIHNTTSNMGATLIILERTPFYVAMARYVKCHLPDAIILLEEDKPYDQHPYLCTLGKHGVMVEVGPQPQGVLRQDVYQQAYDLTCALIDFCAAWNDVQTGSYAPCEAFLLGENVSYPLNDKGERLAMIHGMLQDQDFKPLADGDPVFLHFDGQVEIWQGETTYPHFINEAAYHLLHVAFATATKITL